MSPQKWIELPITDGICTVSLSSWRHFHDYVVEEMLDFAHYVWRGQRDASWKLKSSLDRLLESLPKEKRPSSIHGHLEEFKKATRGRRGLNPSPITEENEWWALGQHHALATPLLDWTHSPFVALYFAFEKQQVPSSGKRAIWALTEPTEANRKATSSQGLLSIKNTLDLIRPSQSENPRLLSQAGLFTRAPTGDSVESWITRNHQGQTTSMLLIKIEMPDEGRTECLRTLNRMNINHATLFPDLYGAGAYCNRLIELGS
jgi:hypothetical protein